MSRKSALLQKPTMNTTEVFEVTKAAAQLVSVIANSDSNQDGKFSVQEVSFALLTQVGQVSVIVTKSRKAFESFRSFSVAERREVVALFAANFDLPNDRAEEQIEVVLSEAHEIVTSLTNLIKKFKKTKAVA